MAKFDFDHTGASGVDDQDFLAGLASAQGDIPAWWLSTANTESWLPPETDSIGADSFAADEQSSTDSGLHLGPISSANTWWAVDGADLPGSTSLSDGLAGDTPFASVPGFLSGLPTGPDAGIITALSTPAADPLGGTDAPTLAGGPAGSDLIFIGDAGADARGGPGGGGGGSGGGSGITDVYISGNPNVANQSEFNIEIDFKGTWSADLKQAFTHAADWLSSIITNDIADVFYKGKMIDDIVITAELKSIDGTGGILGQAGPTAVRTAGYLPATATMQFDVADANTYLGVNLWDDIVQHEMLHCVGYGTIWDYLNLVSGEGTVNSLFTGANATLAYEHEYLSNASADGVPLENNGVSGTADSHWDEQTFSNEIMTGYINNSNYVSGMTIASLEDLGYATTWASGNSVDVKDYITL